MNIKIIDKRLAVCRVKDYTQINLNEDFIFTGKTDEENSLVCPSESVPSNATSVDDGWRVFRFTGILDFSLIGILSRVSAILAENKIGIFAVSTFNTDYILVKEENFEKALNVLCNEGYTLIE